MPQHSGQMKKNRLSDQAISRVFVRLGSIYGQSWTNRWPTKELVNAAKIEWAISLYGFSVGQIGRALEVCKQVFKYSAPNLPQFRDLCKNYSVSAHKPYAKELPKPRCKETARKGIEAAKAALRGETL